MSKKTFKKLMQKNKVIAIPTHKGTNDEGNEVQLYTVVPMKMANLYE